MKARGETVPQVHGMDKELDPHIMPEQQFVSKGATLKGAKPNSTIKTPVKESPHKVGLDTKIDPVKVTLSKDITELPSKSPKLCARTPYSSPYISLIQPKPFSAGTRQKGNSNEEGV